MNVDFPNIIGWRVIAAVDRNLQCWMHWCECSYAVCRWKIRIGLEFWTLGNQPKTGGFLPLEFVILKCRIKISLVHHFIACTSSIYWDIILISYSIQNGQYQVFFGEVLQKSLKVWMKCDHFEALSYWNACAHFKLEHYSHPLLIRMKWPQGCPKIKLILFTFASESTLYS